MQNLSILGPEISKFSKKISKRECPRTPLIIVLENGITCKGPKANFALGPQINFPG
jgi:hypothetical protein